MADLEYGYEFKVYCTQEGFRHSTNSTAIAILDELQVKDNTAQELEAVLKLPLPTIRTVLKRLEKEGLVCSRTSETDGRVIIYSSCNITVFSSATVTQENIFSKTLSSRDAHGESAFKPFTQTSLLFSYFEEYGVDVSPLFERMAAYLANSIYDRYKFKTTTEMIGFLEDYLGNELPCGIHIEEGAMIHITPNVIMKDLHLSAVIWPTVSLISRLYVLVTGKPYAISSIEMDNGFPVGIKLKEYDGSFKPYKYVQSVGSPSPSLKLSRDTFSVYNSVEGTILIHNEVMLNILEQLEERPLTMSDMSLRIRCPDSTTYINLNKVLALKLVEQLPPENASAPMQYRLTGTKLINREIYSDLDSVDFVGIAKDTLDGKNGFYDYMLHYFWIASKLFGLDY